MARRSPLFLLSFRHRDALAAMTERAGWRPIAARRADRIERRFLASAASVAVVDMRSAFEPGLQAVQAVSGAVAANAGALLVLLGDAETAQLGAVYDAGATHYLAEPFDAAEFAQMLRFAERHCARVLGGEGAAARPDLLDAESWRWRRGDPVVELSVPLAARLRAPARLPLRDAARRLGIEGWRAAREAVSRLGADTSNTAFAHGDAQGRRLAHHLHLEENGAVIAAQLERMDSDARARGRRDPLTGLADARVARQWIADRLGDEKGGALALLMIGMPRLETVNAAFGRAAGDRVLRGVARRIEEVLGDRRGRLAARIAGSEFVIGLPGAIGVGEARLLADGLIAAIARPFVAEGHVATLAPRIGIAAAASGDDAATLLRRASLALAEARGRDHAIHVLGTADQDDAERLGDLAVDLGRALDGDEIELRWQPQVVVTSGAIVGVEALARWRHPTFGELGAELLFAVAERSEHLLALSEHLQRKAIAAIAAWPDALAHLNVAINVVAGDIARPDFAAGLLGMLADAGLPHRRITVEITESGLIEDLGAAATLLARLRAAGLRVAIDDFGTGYSSLAYLKALPLDYLKLDKGLAQDIAGSSRDRIVVRGVIEMARSLGLAVIAEGVETEEQLSLLAREGCTLYQGFLCAPPLDTAALVRLVEGNAG